jgi:hypothetical protein
MKLVRSFPALLLLALFAILPGCKSDDTTQPTTGPSITSFTATPASITAGDSVVLKWTVDQSATSVAIDQGIGDVTHNSAYQVTVYPSDTTKYTLTAKNSSGTSTSSITVNVSNPSEAGAPPKPGALTASPAGTNPSTITLSWGASSGASSYIVERRLVGQPFVVISSAASSSTYSDIGLYPGFTYSYRVRSVSGSGARSGYSNVATAVASGPAPTIASITLAPTTVATLTPGQTQQFTAIAVDASGNNLPFAPGTFAWSSSNNLIVGVSQFGLATANQQRGSATITASLPNSDGSVVTSNGVTVTVANQSANTAVILYGSQKSDFNAYMGPLSASGVAYDEIDDFSSGNAAQFTLAQISSYAKVVVIQQGTELSADAESILTQYAAQQGKKLAIITTESNGVIYGTTLARVIGVDEDSYVTTSSVASPLVGQSGSAFAGLSFTLQDSPGVIGRYTLNSSNIAHAAIVGNDVSDPSNAQQFIAAFQTTLATGGTVLYSGIPISGVDAANQNTYIRDVMTF